MILTLQELGDFLGAESSERPGPAIAGVRPVEHARETDITYVTSPRFLDELSRSCASAVIVPPDLDPGGLPHIRHRNPEAAFARLTALYFAHEPSDAGVSARAEVHPEAVLGREVSVGAFCVIGKGARIGDGCVIRQNVVIGENVEIGAHSTLFPNVTVYPRVRIGDRVIIHSGTVIGADGFGFARDADETGAPVYIKKYHSGTVVIEDDVEIGALCAVDRALAGETRIGKGAKIDNLVQIAHSVHVGEGTVIAGQVGIAGSSSIGRFGMVGGQVGVRDHVNVGDGVVLTTRVGIYRNVPDGSVMAGGVPAMPHKLFLRVQPLFKKLPEIIERIRKLERLVQSNPKDNQ